MGEIGRPAAAEFGGQFAARHRPANGCAP